MSAFALAGRFIGTCSKDRSLSIAVVAARRSLVRNGLNSVDRHLRREVGFPWVTGRSRAIDRCRRLSRPRFRMAPRLDRETKRSSVHNPRVSALRILVRQRTPSRTDLFWNGSPRQAQTRFANTADQKRLQDPAVNRATGGHFVSTFGDRGRRNERREDRRTASRQRRYFSGAPCLRSRPVFSHSAQSGPSSANAFRS